jgi:predicted DNA-binding transcriptional regulator AlpA
MKPSTNQPAVLDRFIRQRQLISGGFIAFSHATLWRKVRDGSFPAPVKLSAGVTAWRERDVMEWQRTQEYGERRESVNSMLAARAARYAGEGSAS